MNRILLLLMAVVLPFTAIAQPKNSDEARKEIEKALANTQNEKKATKTATWAALSDAYMAAYEEPIKNLLPNTPQKEVKLFLKGQQVLSTENRKGAENEYVVDIYADKDLYYNQAGILEFWIVTKPVVENALGKALDALKKAAELDVKGSKKKDYEQKAENIHQRFYSEALSNYLKGDPKTASILFEETSKSCENEILNKIDSMSIYYTALMASTSGDKERAIKFYNRCIDINYYTEGAVFSNLAEMYKQNGDKELCKSTLEKGFAKFPENQGILVGLINYYIETGESTEKLFELLHSAQANEPNNASLYYVEGDIYKKLGNKDKAIEFFQKSSDIDSNYVFGILNIGILHYDEAVDLQNAASEELDDAKYSALVDKFEESLLKAIAPFEKSFTMTNDPDIKNAIAEYLKNIYFRFRDKEPGYKEAYEKYNNYLKKD